MPTSRLGAEIGIPSIATLPLDGSINALTIRSKVDLPQPDGPTSATNSSLAMARSTF